jgi:hypothetical protein
LLFAVAVWPAGLLARRSESTAALLRLLSYSADQLNPEGERLKKLLATCAVALAVVIGSPSAADGETQCFEAGAIYVWPGIYLPCELGAQPTSCLRCVTSVEVKEPLNPNP